MIVADGEVKYANVIGLNMREKYLLRVIVSMSAEIKESETWTLWQRPERGATGCRYSQAYFP